MIKISACGICRTDLHIIEGELPTKLPIIPGHQILGVVASEGLEFKIGERVGIAWLFSTCGECEFCKGGRENLCPRARFTGHDVDGGYAEYICVPKDSVFRIPKDFSDLEAAPLLCGGVIGFRALKLTGVKGGELLGLFGFGASAHLVAQVALAQGCQIFVFTRSEEHKRLASELGADWVGLPSEEPPKKLHAAIVFAPSGEIIRGALGLVRRGGTVVSAGIFSTPLPQMDYRECLYHEKTLRSVANCTREDVREFLGLASRIQIRVRTQVYELGDANEALRSLKRGEIRGAGVLKIRS